MQQNWTASELAPVTVESMICQLAGVCDGARMHDSQGFSGADTGFGHSLAERVQAGRPLTLKQAEAALKLVRKYRRQLGGQAVVEAFLKAPVFRLMPLLPGGGVGGTSIGEAPKKSDRQLMSRDKVAVFRFSYDAGLVADIKTIRGEHKGVKWWAKWDGAAREWTVPVNEGSIFPIMAVAERWCFEIEERFRVYHQRVNEKVEESRVVLALNQGRHVMVVGDEILVAVDKPEVLQEFEQALGGVE